MTKFRTRINQISKSNGPIILANDFDLSINDIVKRTKSTIVKLHNYICGIKLNFHLLLRLGEKEIFEINKLAHKYGIQSIADIKLNDIKNTNDTATEILWRQEFDAVIVNPVMGLESLHDLVESAHKNNKGVIALCHMSAPEAKYSYELEIKPTSKKPEKLYQLFLNWAISQRADGIIVGATFPNIIKLCKKKVNGKLDIYSPGIGIQGGKIDVVLRAGTDYLIIGRTILKAKDSASIAKRIQLQTLR